MAIIPKAKGDEEKISQGLQRLAEEDLTFNYVNNAETHEQIINGMGEMHVDVLISKLKSKFGVSVELKAPRIPYREAIRKKVRQQGKHKKQSGGHGQYGDVWIEFEPYDGQELLFEEKIFGGSVPKNFHPAVEKGLRECAVHGILAGYPVVGLKATLVDGSYHDVDSSEMSFKLAAAIAFKEGLKNANPTILEPIYTLKVTVPDSMMGDIIGDINKRRGQIMGMVPSKESGIQEVSAEVPLSEMSSYAIDLRSMSRGRGSFEMEFARYQDAPPNVAQQVIEESKKTAVAEEKSNLPISENVLVNIYDINLHFGLNLKVDENGKLEYMGMPIYYEIQDGIPYVSVLDSIRAVEGWYDIDFNQEKINWIISYGKLNGKFFRLDIKKNGHGFTKSYLKVS
jgi:elongation factor G